MRLLKTLSRFGMKAKSTPVDTIALQALSDIDENSMTDTTMIVCRSPVELPEYESIISGAGKNAKIKLTPEQGKLLVVIANAKSANMVVSTALHNTDESLKLFASIRQQLHTHNYPAPKVIWATPHLILDLNRLRSDERIKNIESEQVNAKNTDHWKRFVDWIRYGISVSASDMHIEVDDAHARIRFRVDGIMTPMQNGSLGDVLAQPARESIATAYNFFSDRGTATGSNFTGNEFLETIVSIDIDGQRVKLRCDSIPTLNGFNFIARFSRASQSYTYDTYGYETWHQHALKRAMASRRGMIILAGIPGSGKTSSVQMMLEDLAISDTLKIATIDTPIEKKIAKTSQTLLPMDESNPEESTTLFNNAIQHWVRGNPDVMSLGEIRSISSGKAAVMLAEIGCLLFGTTHSHNCLGIFQRLISIGVDLYSLTAPGIMNLFVHQTLVPVLCNTCKKPLSAMPKEVQEAMHEVGRRLDVAVEHMHYQGDDTDCPDCFGTGIKGRTVVCEMIQHDTQLLDFILKRDLYGAENYWKSKSDGRYDTLNFAGKSSFYHAFILAQRGTISPDEVKKFGFFEDYPPAREKVNDNIMRMHA